MNIVPTSQAGERLSSENMAATQRMGDKDLYLEMMNELMEATTTTTTTTTREDRITMDIVGPDDQFRRRRYKDGHIQPSSSTTITTSTLQNFFDREKHDRVRHQNSFASDEIYCEMDDDDDNNDDDEDEFYEDDHDTVSSMLQHFKHQSSPFSPVEPSLSNLRDCDMDSCDSMYLYQSPRKPNSLSSSSKPKYNRNRMNAKQMDMLSTSLHTSDGTEVTTTETDYSLNGSSHHSHATMMRSPHSHRRYYASMEVAELPPTVIVYEGCGNDDATNLIDMDVPDIFSLQTHRMLGEGFFGKVYLVSAPSDGKNNNYFALKKISKYHLLCEDQVHTVLREKEILQLCSHPNIATFYATKQDASSLYLLQSYIPGGDLFHLTHHYSCLDHDGCRTNYEYHPILSEECNVQFYVACIADALWYLHCGFSNMSTVNSNRSIVYRDLKPENVMINERGYPILIDFGYAKILETSSLHDDDEEYVAVQSPTLTKTYTMCGTAKYISPEIIEGAGHTCSTDYWSLGIVVYELLTCGREHPFEYLSNMDDLSLYRSIVEADYIPLANEVSLDGVDFVDQLLTKDSTSRLGATESRVYNPLLIHPWLCNWDVSLLRQQSYRAPWIPTAKNPLEPTANHNQNDDSRSTENEQLLTFNHNQNDDSRSTENEQLLTFDMDQQIDPNLTMREQAKFAEF